MVAGNTKIIKDLNDVILEYLKVKGYSRTHETFSSEINEDKTELGSEITNLERKWTVIAHLQKKIMEMERRVVELEAELETSRNRISPHSPQTKTTSKDGHDLIPVDLVKLISSGPRGAINSVIFDDKNGTLITGGDDCKVKIWSIVGDDADCLRLIETLTGPTRPVTSISCSNTSILAVGSADSTIRLFSRENRDKYTTQRTLFGHEDVISIVKFIADNLLVSAGKDGTIRIWDCTNGYCVKVLNGHDESWIKGVDYMDIGKQQILLASADADKNILFWEVDIGDSHKSRLVLRIGDAHEHVIEAVSFVPSEDSERKYRLLTGGRDKVVKLWEISCAGGQNNRVYEYDCANEYRGHDNWIRIIRVSDDGLDFLSISDDNNLKLHRICSKAESQNTPVIVKEVNMNGQVKGIVSGYAKSGNFNALSVTSTSGQILLYKN